MGWNSSPRSRDFEEQGLPTDSPLATKLWKVSQILGVSPFDPSLLDHNPAQLDFILEMWFQENPKKGRFVRKGKTADAMSESLARKSWTDVLRGPALDRYLAKQMPPAAVLARLKANPTMRRPVRMRRPAPKKKA